MKRFLKATWIVLLVAMTSILLHNILPSDANTQTIEFDGVLVQLFGFPVVASFYFIVFFAQLYAAFTSMKRDAGSEEKAIYLRFLVFAILPLVGMLEITPDSVWTYKVSIAQIFVGLGDALPVILLVLLMYLTRTKHSSQGMNRLATRAKSKPLLAVVIAIVFILERVLAYLTGITLSAIHDYPLPCIIWTIACGISFGIVFMVMEPIWEVKGTLKKVTNGKVVLRIMKSIGLNWIWFNVFIALIAKGMMLQMILRSVVDLCIMIVVFLLLRKKEELSQ